MPVVDVSCPACGTKFKAPDTAVGKKAKCKKCGNAFRIAGGAPLPDGAPEVAMADAADDLLVTPAPAPTPAPRPATPAPAKDISSLPSADPFDFTPPAKAATPPKPAPPPGPAPAPKPAATAAPAAKAGFGAARPPAPAAPSPEPPPLEPLPTDDDRFAFSESPAKPKKQRDEDEEPKPKKKGRDEEDEGERPAKKKRKRDEEDEDEPRAKKKAADAEPYNPFADYEAGAGEVVADKNPWDDEKPKPKKKRKKGDEEEEEEAEPEKPRYLRPEEKGGLGMTILITGVIGLFALGLGATAVVVYLKQTRPKEPEQVKEEKKEGEAPPAFPDVPGAPAAGQGGEPKAKEPEPKPKEKEPQPKGKEPEPKAPEMVPGMTRPAAAFARPRSFSVGALPAKPQEADKPTAGLVLEAPADRVKRVFPPADPRSGDTGVLIQSNPGAGGMGEKLALDIYGPAGNRVAGDRIEYDGDGLANPIADFTVTKDQKAYFLAATGGKLHVWSVADRQKVADGVSPYAEKPEHAKSGLAAAFFTADPSRVVLVSTAGAVLLYDLKSKKPLKDFVPPNGAVGRVSLGHSAAKAEGGASVVVAVGGVLYQVQADDKLAVLLQHDLGGDVYRSLGLAVVGAPGRIVYTFEGLADGKKEALALGFPAGAGAKPVAYRFPAATAGEPRGALWAGDEFAGVATDRGVVLFDDNDKKFLPMLFAQPPGAVGHYFGDEKSLWYVIPHPKEEGKSVLAALSMPLEGFESYTKKFVASQPIPAARIDAKGLAK
jgi:hypothetical protein